MNFSRSSLFCLVTGLLGLVLVPLAAQAQQTITATTGQVGVAYSYQVSSNATPPVQYGASGLPSGLVINASSGLITGTPTTPGTVVGTVSVTSGGQTNNAGISITIAAAASTPVITSATSATGTAGTAFTYSATASNTPTSFNITGLPAGLTANTTSGVISGTPIAAGTSSISLSANNSGGTGATVTLTLTVGAAAAAPVITSATTASVAVSASLSYTITATNTPTSFAASGLPLGVSVDTATGAITGTPTVAGVYTVGLSATNAGGTSSTVNLTLTVGALSSITSSATSTAAVGVAYTYTATASPAATSFNISGLPSGLTANTATGVISGTPAAAAVSSVSLSANNATGTGPVTVLTLTVGNRPVITSATSASGTAGSAFTYTITASNSPTSFAATGLPSGLTVNTTTGVISGTPSGAGSSSVSLTATNGFGTGVATALAINIAASGGSGGGGGGGGGGSVSNPPVIVAGPADQTVVAGVNVVFSVQATGSTPLVFQWRKNGVDIAGATTATLVLTSVSAANAGSYSVSIANIGGSVISSSAVLAIVGPPAITVQPAASQTVAAGTTVSLGVTAVGTGTITYQWRRDGVAIAGATSSTLTLTGTTAASANGSYTVVVTNSNGSVTSSAAAVTIIDSGTPPSIVLQPATQTISLNGSATLSVSAASATALTYQWRKDGVAIAGATGASLALTNATAATAGSYTVVVTNAAGSTTSSTAVITLGSRLITGTYFGTFGGTGGTFALYVRDDRSGVFLGYARGAKVTLISREVVIDSAGRFQVTAAGAGPTAAAISIGAEAAEASYVISGSIGGDGAVSGTVAGLNLSLAATPAGSASGAGFYQAGAAGSSATSYVIVAPTGEAFVASVNGATADAGKGTIDPFGRLDVTTENSARVVGTIQSTASTISLNVTPSGGTAITFVGANNDARTDVEKLLNISSRGATTSDSSLVAGFVITGTQPKSVLLRAIGPTLTAFNLTGVLSAARLEVFSGSTSIAVGTDWGAAANASTIAATAARVGAFALANNSRDAAILLTLNPGAYTAIVTGQGGATGVCLVEAYDATNGVIPTAQRIINISSRATVGPGQSTLIGGFVISGTIPKRVLVRGVGPGLVQFGLPGALARPQLLLYKGANVIAQNTGWTTSSDATAIAAAAVQTGAFALAAGSLDSALLISLEPGNYTAQVVGVGNTTGVALVEIYDVP